MDNKTFITRLSRQLKRDYKETSALVEGLATVMRDSCGNLDTVAIPSFGKFTPVKHDERIGVNPATGRRALLPPSITVEFSAAAMLKKRLYNE